MVPLIRLPAVSRLLCLSIDPVLLTSVSIAGLHVAYCKHCMILKTTVKDLFNGLIYFIIKIITVTLQTILS